MGAAREFFTVIVIPALISLALYLSLTLFFIPLWRRHRERYDQYLPLNTFTTSISSRTSSLQDRIANTLTAFVMPSFRPRREDVIVDGSPRRTGSVASDDELFGAEEAEDMVGFDVGDLARRRDELRREVGGMQNAAATAERSGPRLGPHGYN